LGGSVALAVLRSFAGVKVAGYAHRPQTRRKAASLAVASEICGDIAQAVSDADLVIVATPICTFERIFGEVARAAPPDCIVTDVGSTKVWPGRWAAKKLGTRLRYVGSHPIAGSEQRGIEFARDDLFDGAMCVLTATEKTDRRALGVLKEFWTRLGCHVKTMGPLEHDRIFANISHLPHVAAAALLNANDSDDVKFAGKGFMDTSRVASGPVNVWADIFLTNKANVARGIERMVGELLKLKDAIKGADRAKLEKLLGKARDKRSKLVRYKVRSKELES